MKKSLFLVFITILMFCACSSPAENNVSFPDGLEHISDTMEVHFIDVGQADCSLLLLPTGQTMLIDAGNNDDASIIRPYFDKLGIKKIDYVIGTHPHEDHIGALDYVIKRYEIGKVFMPDAANDTKSYRDLTKALSNKGIESVITAAPMVLYDDGTLKMEVVAPVKVYEDLNNTSIVLRITYKNASFLFTGDAEEESEKDITADVASDVLSVGHHGSSTSTSDRFLKRVDPMYAVISCGEGNDYGHPHYETLEKLKNDDITTYRTDIDGTLICTTKGNKGDYVWTTEK